MSPERFSACQQVERDPSDGIGSMRYSARDKGDRAGENARQSIRKFSRNLGSLILRALSGLNPSRLFFPAGKTDGCTAADIDLAKTAAVESKGGTYCWAVCPKL